MQLHPVIQSYTHGAKLYLHLVCVFLFRLLGVALIAAEVNCECIEIFEQFVLSQLSNPILTINGSILLQCLQTIQM